MARRSKADATAPASPGRTRKRESALAATAAIAGDDESTSVTKAPTLVTKNKGHEEEEEAEQREQTLLPLKLKQGDTKKLREAVQFPLAVGLSFTMASLGYSLLGVLTDGELARVSRAQDTWAEVGVLAVWRVAELALGWYGGFDSLDVAMLDLLAHGPASYLLASFYGLSPATAAASLGVDIISIAAPFYLLRPLSAFHKPSSKVPNRELIDLAPLGWTSALSTAIYSVILVISLHLVLPRILVLYFNGVPSVEPAYAASYSTVLPVTLLFGIAGSTFIFAPFATTGKAHEDDKIAGFDPVEATLGETVWWNLWGYTNKTKVVIRRTAVAVVVTGINTYLTCSKTIYGVEPAGAAAYAGIWAFAALCTGLGLGLVGKE